MSTPDISIIVPIYNAQEFLPRCIDSILSQDFHNFELLLIDDGSKDLSAEICDDYAAKDNRVRVFHIPNGGAAHARNVGLDNAKGSYIMFADADDYLSEEAFSTAIREVKADKLDFLQFSYQQVDMHERPIYSEVIKEGGTELLSGKEYFDTEMYIDYVWSCAISKKLIDSGKIRFIDGLKLSEDTIFSLTCIEHAQRAKRIPEKLYNYVINDQSVSHTNSYRDVITKLDAILKFSLSHPMFKKRIDSFVFYNLTNLIENRDVPYSAVKRIYHEANFRYYRKLSSISHIFHILTKTGFTPAFLFLRYIGGPYHRFMRKQTISAK